MLVNEVSNRLERKKCETHFRLSKCETCLQMSIKKGLLLTITGHISDVVRVLIIKFKYFNFEIQVIIRGRYGVHPSLKAVGIFEILKHKPRFRTRIRAKVDDPI